MQTVYELSKQGRSAVSLPLSDTPCYNLDESLLTKQRTILPELSEVGFVRHYTELAKHAFGVDDGFYPLGSCTMKYNPKINEQIARLEGFTSIHPLCDEKDSQGCLAVMYNLAKALSAITGMSAFTLEPAAGAHGEYTGLMLIRAYHNSRKDAKRRKIIVPDSAHGTNPASSTLAGFEIINISSDEEGSVDLEAFEAALDDTVAGLMLTNPNTLGKLDKNILKITKAIHDIGGLNYYDGANLNAIMGIVRPADMGFDVIHLNLHKTFSTPHGGGGPGSGPVGTVKALEKFLPSYIEKNQKGYSVKIPKNRFGRVKAFYGNFGVMLKAYAYISMLGREGIPEAAKLAVLNANYLKKLLSEIDYKSNEGCMHEFVLSLERLHDETGVSALDIAKAMIDKGMHPPTMYFPLIVHEALMFEPTETETKETLEMAAAAILEIVRTAYTSPEEIKSSPKSAYISRPDEVTAARNPKLRG